MQNQPIPKKELLETQTRGGHTGVPARPAVPHGKACEPERPNTPLGAQSPFQRSGLICTERHAGINLFPLLSSGLSRSPPTFSRLIPQSAPLTLGASRPGQSQPCRMAAGGTAGASPGQGRGGTRTSCPEHTGTQDQTCPIQTLPSVSLHALHNQSEAFSVPPAEGSSRQQLLLFC